MHEYSFIQQLGLTAFSILGPCLVALGMLALKRLNTKLGLEVSAEDEARMQMGIALAVREVEEWASSSLKHDGVTVTPEAQEARAIASARADGYLPSTMGDRQAGRLVRQAVQTLGLGASGNPTGA